MPDFLRVSSALAALLLAPLLRAAELTVLAATSLSDSLQEAAPLFTTATGHTFRFNFAASGALARQIKEGAPADVFISADEPRLEQLISDNLLLPDTRRVILANTLVLIVPVDASALDSLDGLQAPRVRRISIGDPATVPAGTYARQHLEKLGLWTPLRAKLVPVDSVRAALSAVESGNADAAFVYRTDALSSEKVRVALEFPPPVGPAIAYPAALVRDTRRPEPARAFLAWLAGPEAAAIFARHGFLPAPAR